MQSLSGSKTCATLPSSVVWTPSSLALFDLLLLLEASSNALFCWEFLFWLWHPIPVAVVAAPVGVVAVGGVGVGCSMVLVLVLLLFTGVFGWKMTIERQILMVGIAGFHGIRVSRKRKHEIVD